MSVRELQQPRGTTSAAPATLILGSRIDFHGGHSELARRIHLSSGTFPACDDADLACRYVEGTFVPATPWREATPHELALLNVDRAENQPAWRPGADVAIIRLPNDIVTNFTDMLEQHGIRETTNRKAYVSVSNHPRWAENLAALGRHLAPLSDGELSQIYFRMADPGQLTVTKNEFGKETKRQLRVGLHVDHWDGLALHHRSRARNRLCVNLSREPRYSLFFNLPMMDMFRGIGLRDPEDIYSDFRGLYLAQRFMKAWPEYPVIRLRLDPGEGYILPTDNLVHDASTEGNRYTDITLTYLGLFVPDSR